MRKKIRQGRKLYWKKREKKKWKKRYGWNCDKIKRISEWKENTKMMKTWAKDNTERKRRDKTEKKNEGHGRGGGGIREKKRQG